MNAENSAPVERNEDNDPGIRNMMTALRKLREKAGMTGEQMLGMNAVAQLERSVGRPSVQWKCGICLQLVKNFFYFKDHVARHEGEKTWTCTDCESFVGQNGLTFGDVRPDVPTVYPSGHDRAGETIRGPKKRIKPFFPDFIRLYTHLRTEHDIFLSEMKNTDEARYKRYVDGEKMEDVEDRHPEITYEIILAWHTSASKTDIGVHRIDRILSHQPASATNWTQVKKYEVLWMNGEITKVSGLKRGVFMTTGGAMSAQSYWWRLNGSTFDHPAVHYCDQEWFKKQGREEVPVRRAVKEKFEFIKTVLNRNSAHETIIFYKNS